MCRRSSGAAADDTEGNEEMADNKGTIKVNCFVVGMVQTNFYYLHRENSKETIVFDPADLGDRLYEELEKLGLEVKAIFLTHAHFDHIFGVEALKARTGAPVYACIHEKNLCESPRLNQSQMTGRPCTVSPDFYLQDNEEVTIAAGQPARVEGGRILQGRMDAYNDFENAPLKIESFTDYEAAGGKVRVSMPPCSVAELRLRV